jgi:hypothetical protein
MNEKQERTDKIQSKRNNNSKFYEDAGLCANAYFFFFAVLGFEVRAYTLSHSTSPFS